MTERPTSWTEVDPVERVGRNLGDEDNCYYYLVRFPGGYDRSVANDRISNFKKDPESFRGRPDVWHYKELEIKCFAEDVCAFLEDNGFQSVLSSSSCAALVPMPTSKPKSHKLHDSRLEELCEIVAKDIEQVVYENPFDVTEQLESAHSGGRRDVGYLDEKITFGGFLSCTPDLVILIDDVLTTGNHYAVCRDKIKKTHPDAQIIGIFLSIHRNDIEDAPNF